MCILFLCVLFMVAEKFRDLVGRYFNIVFSLYPHTEQRPHVTSPTPRPIFTGSKMICGQSIHIENPSSVFKREKTPKQLVLSISFSFYHCIYFWIGKKMIKCFVILFSLGWNSWIFSTGPCFVTLGRNQHFKDWFLRLADRNGLSHKNDWPYVLLSLINMNIYLSFKFKKNPKLTKNIYVEKLPSSLIFVNKKTYLFWKFHIYLIFLNKCNNKLFYA